MRIVVVGQYRGKRHICWGATVVAACLAGTIGALGAVVASYALAWQLSPLAVALGFTGGIIAVGSGVVRAMQLPLERLTSLDR
jgi:hypothetical protein